MNITQQGPDKAYEILADLVSRMTYKPGWTFQLSEMDRGQGCVGTTLCIAANVPDSSGNGQQIGFLHLMPVPAAAYNAQSWTRWLMEQVLLVEKHEALEFFRIDGHPPFYPSHAPGWHPYDLREHNTPEEAFGEADMSPERPSEAKHLR